MSKSFCKEASARVLETRLKRKILRYTRDSLQNGRHDNRMATNFVTGCS
jgi:hypothetical protein